MAYAPLPKLLPKPADTGKMCPKDWSKSNLASILQSDAVRRLFNQPNIIIRAIPCSESNNATRNKNARTDTKNGITADLNRSGKKPEVTIVPVKMSKDAFKEDISLLSSKIESRSEIALLPIKTERKECGHCEPCEKIVCDVAVQQYVDRDGASPMLATNIEDDEINAPVSRHCSNEKCDALSIDHNRCRRAMIKLYRCDKSKACDICGKLIKTRKSRVHHKNCTRKDVYRHNEMSSAEILKERMREREIQMLEAAKTKKNNYSDPILGTSLAMEALKKNGELIIIPKSIQKPSITITPIPTTQSSSQTNNVKNVYGKVLPNAPVAVSKQNVLLSNTMSSKENFLPQKSSGHQVRLPDIINNQLMTKVTNAITIPQNQIIRFTGASQNNAQPITINDWLISQPQIATTTVQPKQPILTPIRVVPITNLITQPSLFHQTQGIPKFCIMADNAASSVTITNSQAVQSIKRLQHVQPAQIIQSAQSLKLIKPKPDPTSVPNVTAGNNLESKPMIRKKKRMPKMSVKRKIPKKQYRCNYCLKRFSTGWYFGVHVATHKSEKRYHCKLNGCAESFINRCDLRKHSIRHHKNEHISCDTCNYVSDSYISFERHMKTHKIVNKPFTCSTCNTPYQSHMQLKHHIQKCHGKLDFTEKKVCEEIKTIIKEEYEIVDEMDDTEVSQDMLTIEGNNTLKALIPNQQVEEQTENNKGFVHIPANVKVEIDNMV